MGPAPAQGSWIKQPEASQCWWSLFAFALPCCHIPEGNYPALLWPGHAPSRAAEAPLNNNNYIYIYIYLYTYIYLPPCLSFASIRLPCVEDKTTARECGFGAIQREVLSEGLARSQSSGRAVCTAATPKSDFTAAPLSLHRVSPDLGSGLFLAARLLKTLEPETDSLCPHVCCLLL